MKKIDIEFDFRGHHHDAFVRIWEMDKGREFQVTIMDWELERVLYGNHTMKEVNGAIQANVLPENKDQTELKLTIAAKLGHYLGIPCFSGDQCVNESPPKEGWEGLHPLERHLPKNL